VPELQRSYFPNVFPEVFNMIKLFCFILACLWWPVLLTEEYGFCQVLPRRGGRERLISDSPSSLWERSLELGLKEPGCCHPPVGRVGVFYFSPPDRFLKAKWCRNLRSSGLLNRGYSDRIQLFIKINLALTYDYNNAVFWRLFRIIKIIIIFGVVFRWSVRQSFPWIWKGIWFFVINLKNHMWWSILTIPEPAMAEPTGKMNFSASWLSDITDVMKSRNVSQLPCFKAVLLFSVCLGSVNRTKGLLRMSRRP